MFKVIVFFMLLLPVSCLAQFTVTGKILNAANNGPLANANVFLNNASVGSASIGNGTFTLSNVKGGKYKLVVSMVGFETFSETILVNNNIKIEDISLSPKAIALKEVVIKPDPYREAHIAMFKEQFLGKTESASECKLLNPEVLDFDYDDNTKTLTASSYNFLDIENDALGYKIKYLLTNFTYSTSPDSPKIQYKGDVFFQPLKGSASQQRQWERKRLDVYGNSAMHFFRSVMAGRITEEGFRVQQYTYIPNPERPTDSVIAATIAKLKIAISSGPGNGPRAALKIWEKKKDLPKMIHVILPYSLTQPEIIGLTNMHGVYTFSCEGSELFVTYSKNGQFNNNPNINHLRNPLNTENTLISFNEPFALIDRDGVIADPYSIPFSGVWANKRVAELLPVDYDVPQKEIETVTVDSTVSNKISAKLDNYLTNHALEKAYLHFDRPYYAAGDTMYFKAYVTLGGGHNLSALSGILHVDLVTANNKINRSLTLGIIDGVAWGDFVLPDSLVKGNYQVRAYTQWMRNDNGAQFFDKIIPVGAVIDTKMPPLNSNKQPAIIAKPDVQFFAEGGSLVAGVRSKIAFKAIGANGLGIKFKGEVINSENKIICSFSPAHLGMGYFYFTPAEGELYKARVTYANGAQDVFNLPAADKNGIALAVNNDSTLSAMVTITAGQQYFAQNKNKYFTLAVYNGGSLINMICRLDSSVVMLDILKPGMLSGITRLTLFSPTGEPLCERLIFIQNRDELKLDLSSDKKSYAPRGKVNINLNVSNNDGKLEAGHFSVSVTNENKAPVDEKNESTILNNLLLTSDLKGFVEQPNYYFSAAPEVPGNLDVLMLTQGYRGFEWKQALNENLPAPVYPPENSLELSGTVKTLTGKPVPSGKVTLLSPKPFISRDTITDKNGNFKFTDLYLTDTARLILTAVNKNNSRYVKLELNKPGYPALTITSNTDSANYITPGIALAMQKQYRASEHGIVLKQVNIKGNKIRSGPKLTHSANLNGPGQADFVLMGDKLVGCANLIDCLRGLIPGVMYQDGIMYSMHTHYEFSGSRQPMVIIIDGMLYDQKTTSGSTLLDGINADDIYSIEVLTSLTNVAVYGADAAGGALVITTKRGDEEPGVSNKSTSSVHYTFNGYYKAHTFYSPRYDVVAPVSNHPDLRTTIYWNPELITGKDGDASFEFYNADEPGTYRIVVEGIDANGDIGRRVYRYTVK